MSEHRIEYPCPVRRLNVVWRDGEWSIEGEIRVPSMTLPASTELPDTETVSGFWWEVVDRDGGVIYRRGILDPFTSGLERFDDGGLISRVPTPTPKEVGFDVTLPDIAEAAVIHFYSSTPPGGREAGSRGAERIAAIDVPSQKEGDDGYR